MSVEGQWLVPRPAIGVGYLLAGWSSRQLREVYRAALLGRGSHDPLARWKSVIFLLFA